MQLTPEHISVPNGSDLSRSIDLLGYRTKHSLRDGLVKMVDWARKLGPQEPTYTLPLEITKKAPRVWLEKAM